MVTFPEQISDTHGGISFILHTSAVADPGINKRGAPISQKNYTHQSWHLYALEGPGGMLPREILKINASNDSFWPKYGRFIVFGTLIGGGGRPLDPPLMRECR